MDIRKLQRAIVNGLEDVKAQDIVVFNTEKLSPLFERVVVASGTSNRQTKALASSVREAVKAAGGQILSVEGEDNGEWIIVDCGAAVAHVMQPAIRQYYHLEEIWGGKPVRLKLGSNAPRGLPKASEGPALDDEDDGSSAGVDVVSSSSPRARRSGSAAEAIAPAKKAARKAPSAKGGAAAADAPAAARQTAPRKAAPRRRPVAEAPMQTVVIQPARKTTGTAAAGKAAARKAPARKPAAPATAPARAPAAKKAAPRKTAARKTAGPRG